MSPITNARPCVSGHTHASPSLRAVPSGSPCGPWSSSLPRCEASAQVTVWSPSGYSTATFHPSRTANRAPAARARRSIGLRATTSGATERKAYPAPLTTGAPPRRPRPLRSRPEHLPVWVVEGFRLDRGVVPPISIRNGDPLPIRGQRRGHPGHPDDLAELRREARRGHAAGGVAVAREHRGALGRHAAVGQREADERGL